MRLIVIEGTDSSGKQTQAGILSERLKVHGEVQTITFPDYKSRACEPVKMYLAGEFGEDAGKVNPYPVSVMYAIDRYASYVKEWGKPYRNGVITVADRYVTSNLIHQAAKISDGFEKAKYLRWVKELEYSKMGIPRPDLVIFLNMPTEFAIKLMEDRKNKITGEAEKDIHEKDPTYLEESYQNALIIAKHQNWHIIDCVRNGEIRSVSEIAEDVYRTARMVL